MTDVVAELGKRIADRWLDLLVLPGLLWLGTLAVAIRLGQEHPFDVSRLQDWLDRLSVRPAAHSLATVVLAAAGLLLASAAAGLAATALGNLLQRMWVLPGQRRPLAWLVWMRRRRWETITSAAARAIAQAANPAAYCEDPARALTSARPAEPRPTALPDLLPDRPTWIGDRFRATAKRASDVYGLILDLAWPRLRPLLPDVLRADLDAAQDAYTAAARLTAWGLLYAALASIWWPAAVLGAVISCIGWMRARGSANILAKLVESAIDLHLSDLADKLGVPTDPPVTADAGRAITDILAKRSSSTSGNKNDRSSLKNADRGPSSPPR